MLVDRDIEWVREYRGSSTAPGDLAEFWRGTLEEAAAAAWEPRFTPVPTALTLIDIYDVSFAGFAGSEVRGWLRVPAGTDLNGAASLPGVVTYVGYGGGRGEPEDNLLWVAAGFAHLQMDTRGQGAKWSRGDTEDVGTAGPGVPGMMTRGIRSREDYYYRRLITDAVRAVDTARAIPVIDNERLSVHGHSQGGGLALAVASLRSDLAAVVALEPFLSDFPRAVRITDSAPYREITDYLAIHRGEAESVHHVLSYFDVTNLVPAATAPALITVALMDAICPPSTVYAAHNAYGGPRRIIEWEYNSHEGGQTDAAREAIAFILATLKP
ncbi:acetylxylan esterase [Mycetocola spongiae]|uniref:acetylxylan esterase n=1 Tax=Mycetocola spongiae TaxID=2859226 RepID=UPI001CF31BC5|nr:acetylxylan esterase [Mycetocola spongiae]UCR89938.1 acetylxylan esterase [Mycetocola spongiae]